MVFVHKRSFLAAKGRKKTPLLMSIPTFPVVIRIVPKSIVLWGGSSKEIEIGGQWGRLPGEWEFVVRPGWHRYPVGGRESHRDIADQKGFPTRVVVLSLSNLRGVKPWRLAGWPVP